MLLIWPCVPGSYERNRSDYGIEENLALALRRGQTRTLRAGIKGSEREVYKRLLATLGLGLEDRLTSKVGLLSGGQRQALTLLMGNVEEAKAVASG